MVAQIFEHIGWIGFPQARQRYMGGETAAIGGQANRLADTFMSRMKPSQFRAVLDAGIKRVGLVAAEKTLAFQTDIKGAQFDGC